jgi:hypothetical protein
VARDPHRANERSQARADPAIALHFPRRLADCLDHERDRALVAVEVGDRERDAFSLVVRHHDDELARARGFGQQWMVNLEQEGDVRELLPSHDFEAGSC